MGAGLALVAVLCLLPSARAAAADGDIVAACHFTSGPFAGQYEPLNTANEVGGSPCDDGKASSGKVELILMDNGLSGSSMTDRGRRTYEAGSHYCIFERGPLAGDQVDWKGGRVGNTCTVGQSSGTVH